MSSLDDQEVEPRPTPPQAAADSLESTAEPAVPPAAESEDTQETAVAPPPLPPLHLEQVQESPRAEATLDQRQITVQWFETETPFRFDELDARLRRAWLSAQALLGVYRGNDSTSRQALHVILGLQGDRYICRFDYETHEPRFYRASRVVVETLQVRYYRHASGNLAFMTAGGRKQITQQRLTDFHTTFLDIPPDAVRGQDFDSDTLRRFVIERFREKLHRMRITQPSSEAYRSIDEVSFRSRKLIDPTAQRAQEILDDPLVRVESFESEVGIRTDALAREAKVRFEIRASGSVRLQFPRLWYKRAPAAPTGQADLFYGLVRETIDTIVDADYFARRQIQIANLEASENWTLFAGKAGSAPFVGTFSSADVRRVFFADLDLAASERLWLPHLQAINAVMVEAAAEQDVRALALQLVGRDPVLAARLLFVCRDQAALGRVGEATAAAIEAQLTQVPDEHRPTVNEALLAWFVARENAAWDVDPATSIITGRSTRWSLEDVPFEAIPAILWKLVVVVHGRLVQTEADVQPDLQRLAWCFEAARALHPLQPGVTPGLRLVLAGEVPVSVQDAARVLPAPPTDSDALDGAVLQEFGLPLWPCFRATRAGANVELTNEGLGTAHAVWPDGAPSSDADGPPESLVLRPGASASVTVADGATHLGLTFEKFGRRVRVVVPIGSGDPASGRAASPNSPRPKVERKRLAALRSYRSEIDPRGVVVGSTPSILEVFEQIKVANAAAGEPPVLILGERGVGKTHIASLIHATSSRRVLGPEGFFDVTAAGSGGDPHMQLGRWVGFGRGHGLPNIPPDGQPGHLMRAHGGTLFVDEVQFLSPELQGVFLSVLEGRAIDKVGTERLTPNVRCVFATNADPYELVARGQLRADLLGRIPVRVSIPPLRERRGDILLLARHFAGAAQKFPERALLALVRHDWPDNVRELQSAVRLAVARAQVAGAAAIEVVHLGLPAALTDEIERLPEDHVQRDLWSLADAAARDEGHQVGDGLQQRVAEIIGVSKGQASKVYAKLGLRDSNA